MRIISSRYAFPQLDFMRFLELLFDGLGSFSIRSMGRLSSLQAAKITMSVIETTERLND